MNPTELVPSLSIDNLLSQRDAIVERLRTAAGLLGEIEQLADSAFPLARDSYNRASPSLEDGRMHVRFPQDLEAFEKAVDAAAWDHLLTASGLRSFMDATARKQWDEAIDKRKVPELTDANIRSTFAELYTARGAMFERGVVEVFRRLSWDYKTNSPRKFGKRIIVEYFCDTWNNGGKRWVSGFRYETCNRLDDLLRVLCILDNKPEPDSRESCYRRWRRSGIDMKQTPNPLVVEGQISIRWFKNGNGHLTFLRPDLVEQMNLILAKHHPDALPPGPCR